MADQIAKEKAFDYVTFLIKTLPSSFLLISLQI